jgi:hypothetical protein
MSPTRSSHSPTHHQRTTLPGSETLVVVETSPHASCVLRHDEIKDRTMRLDADETGNVRFHVRAPHGSNAITVHLDCTGEDGGTTRHSVEIRGDPHYNPAATPEEGAAGSRAPASTHPPLAGDPLAPTNRELISRGYPPRPDPVAAPGRYARWLKKVSRPITRVNPKKVARPDVSFARAKTRAEAFSPTLPVPPPATGKHRVEVFSPTLPLPPPLVRPMFNNNSLTWSGAQLTNPVGQFFWIQADWPVPGVFAFPGSPPYSAAAEWVGLDNSATDLFQSGTDSECWVIPLFGTWVFTNYWMWIEDLPWAPWGLPNFPLSPGDEISVDIFLADQFGTTWFQNGEEGNGGLTPADNNVWFMIYNTTKGLSYWGTLPAPANSYGGLRSSGYTGSSAEFIIERPTDLSTGNAFPLAAFGVAVMQGCWYGDSEYGTRGWVLPPAGSTPFDATLTYLNMTNSSGGLLALPLSLPDPSTPGDSEILWLWLNYS